MSEETPINVTVAWSPGPREVREIQLALPAGATLAEALQAAGVAMPQDATAIGVWGRKSTPARLLKDGDRVEVYRPLRVDPKIARRERFAQQGSKRAGLFAERRPGAKPGY